jgi:GTP-binding protein
LTIDLPEDCSGTAVEAVTKRKGEMTNMEPKGNRMIIQILNSVTWYHRFAKLLVDSNCWRSDYDARFIEFQPYKGEIPGRLNGS